MERTKQDGIVPSRWCGEQPSNVYAFRAERIHISLLEFMVTYFYCLREVNALSLVNHSWNEKIAVSKKKYPCIDRNVSLLVFLRVQESLVNTEKSSMTSDRLLRLVKIEKFFSVKILPFSHIRHFYWNEVFYEEVLSLQKIFPHSPDVFEQWLCCHHWELNPKQRKLCSDPVSDLLHYKQAIDIQAEGHGLLQLRNFTALQSLNIEMDFSSNALKDVDCTQIVCLKETLQSLRLQSSYITDVGLQVLLGFSALQKLELQIPEMTDDGLNVLNGLNSLQRVSFFRCKKITGVGLNALTGHTALRSLNFIFCGHITAANLTQLAHLTGLQKLKFSGCPLKDAGELKSFSALRSLRFWECENVTDADLDQLKGLSSLVKVGFQKRNDPGF